MTYSFGLIPTTPVDSTPETARWYKLTPEVISWLQAVYPQDRGVREMISRVIGGPVYMGVSATGEDLFWMTATETGNIGGSYKSPAASDAPAITYPQVLAVFAPLRSGPDTKPVFRRNTAVRRSNTGLYASLGVGVAVLLGVAYFALKKKATAELVANRRRRLRRNLAYPVRRQDALARAESAW